MRKIVEKIRIIVTQYAPRYGLGKKIIVGLYIGALLISRKYNEKKDSIHQAIAENYPDLLFDHKKYKKMFQDVLYCCFVYKSLPQEYFSYEFNMLSHEGRSTFVTCGNKKPYYKIFNNPNCAEFLNKKTETFRKYGKFFGRDVVAIVDETDYIKFTEFVTHHPQFIYKPAEDSGGNGIKIYDTTKFNSIRELFDVLILGGACVVEELIQQGKPLSVIHSGTVNTVRYVTFLTPNGQVIPQWSFLRMGSGNSVTDNMSGGGISAKIDMNTGIICDYGRDYKRNKFMYHPDSGFQLLGYQLPAWDELKKIANECANVMPELRFVGWDFAYSINGWILVEGNAQAQCVAPQITEYGGILYTYKNMLKIYNEEIGEPK